ncbi:MAG TPA: hypothetical protein GXX75_22845 [Clostridiales bacterium]|nr:hypothetical protein [Clostridiales bacterium]
MKKYYEILEKNKKVIADLCGNCSISFPVPDLVNSILVEKVFLYPSSPAEVRTRPFALVTSAMEDGTILKYENAYVFDFVPTQKYPFEEKINYGIPDGEKKSPGEHRLEMELLAKLYEEIRSFVFEESLTADQKELLTKYYVIFEKSVPVAQLPFYDGMSEKYKKWMVEHV